MGFDVTGQSNRKIFIIACLMGALAFLGNTFYWNGRLDEFKERKLVTIVRAKTGIKPGTPFSAKVIEKVTVPKQYAPKAAIQWDTQQNYLGQEVAVEVLPGDYILENHFAVRAAIGRTLSQQIDGQNFRAITLPVDDTNSFSRSLISGDTIDIIFTFAPPSLKQKVSIVLLQSVPVISTGTYSPASQELGDRGGKSGAYNTVTLKVAVQDAFRLNYARQAGTLNFVLRGGTDNNAVNMTPIVGVQDILSGGDKEAIEAMIKQAGEKYDVSAERVEAQIREQTKQALEQAKKQYQAVGR